jgi:hypothetical protein
LTDTPTWQLATLPSSPQYWRATPGEKRPHFGIPVSSIAHATGPSSPHIRRASRRRTAVSSHGESDTNCCSPWSSTSPRRCAIGCIDLRRPSIISPRV